MNNEDAFLFSTFCEFLKCWRSGKKARVIIESQRGHAFVNFSAYLGHPDDVHFKPRPTKRKPSGGPRKKSARKIKRDNERAARFKEEESVTASPSTKPVDNPGVAPPGPSPAVTSSPGAASAMTTSSLVFSFASPVPENMRQESCQEESMSMTLSDKKEQREPEASK